MSGRIDGKLSPDVRRSWLDRLADYAHRAGYQAEIDDFGMIDLARITLPGGQIITVDTDNVDDGYAANVFADSAALDRYFQNGDATAATPLPTVTLGGEGSLLILIRLALEATRR